MKYEPKPSSFIFKFNTILRNPEFHQTIKLDEEKGKIYIFDKEKLEVQILSAFFRHNKLTSFVRQLNLYGFRKIKNTTYLCYTHENLISGQSLLSISSKKNIKKDSHDHESSSEDSKESRQQIQGLKGQKKSKIKVQQGQFHEKSPYHCCMHAPCSLAPDPLRMHPYPMPYYNGWWNPPHPYYNPAPPSLFPMYYSHPPHTNKK